MSTGSRELANQNAAGGVTGSPKYLDRKLKYANYLHRKYQSGML
jgi:hypothetical protein